MKKTESITYTRTCKLNKIKECSVIFTTNKKNKVFCCDNHRYQWHNSLRSLFRRIVLIEDSFDDIKKAFSKLAEVMVESFGDPLEKIAEFLEEKKNK